MFTPNFKFAGALIAGALLVGCGGSSDDFSQAKIIDGSTPSRGGLIEQSTVALVNSSGSTFCSGTLVDARHVVSAAHCLSGFRGTLYIGFGQGSSTFQYIAASDFGIHQNYDDSFLQAVPADISFIELSKPAPSGYNPVSLFTGTLRQGDTIYLAGFGQTERGSSGTLLYRSTTIASQTSDEFYVSQGACYGDSGGPAYIYTGSELQVIGATSRAGNWTSTCRGSAIYTNVGYFRNWLNSNGTSL